HTHTHTHSQCLLIGPHTHTHTQTHTHTHTHTQFNKLSTQAEISMISIHTQIRIVSTSHKLPQSPTMCVHTNIHAPESHWVYLHGSTYVSMCVCVCVCVSQRECVC